MSWKTPLVSNLGIGTSDLTYCSNGLNAMNKHLAGSRPLSCVECKTYRSNVQAGHAELESGVDSRRGKIPEANQPQDADAPVGRRPAWQTCPGCGKDTDYLWCVECRTASGLPADQVPEGRTTETLEEFTKGAEEGTADSNAGRVRPLEDVVADLDIANTAAEDDYTWGYEAGRRSRDEDVAQANNFYEASAEEARVVVHKVSGLQKQLYVDRTWADETMRRMELAEQERDTALEQVCALVEALESLDHEHGEVDGSCWCTMPVWQGLHQSRCRTIKVAIDAAQHGGGEQG